jgi:hypothetical protein
VVVGGLLATGVLGGTAGAGASSTPSWTVVTTPQPSDMTMLNAVSCPTPSSCVAVGTDASATAGYVNLVQTGTGGVWSSATVPDPPNSIQSILKGVACTSARSCVAVGYGITRHGENAFPESDVWNGTAWTVRKVPLPAGDAGGILNGVSCLGPRDCEAVGDDSDSGGTLRPVAEAWNGSAWTAQTTPKFEGGLATLEAVSCTPTSCLAVGVVGGLLLAERWNGTAWKLALNKTAITGGLLGVSCTGPTTCEAVGTGPVTTTSEYQNLAASWNGTTWTEQAVAQPASGLAELDAVSCTSATACTATGGGSTGSVTSMTTEAEVWNGSTWTFQTTGDPGTGPDELFGVSCTGPCSCTAAGDSGSGQGSISYAGLVETEAG